MFFVTLQLPQMATFLPNLTKENPPRFFSSKKKYLENTVYGIPHNLSQM